MERQELLSRGSSSGAPLKKSPGKQQRSKAISDGSPYEKAAALIDLAEDGIGIPEEILNNESTFVEATKLYLIFIKFDFIWTLNYFALLLLNFLEKPLWCSQNLAISCNDRDYYFLGQLPYLDGAGSLIFEGITLVILIVHMFFPISYEGFNLYLKSHLNKLKIIFLLILVADIFIFVLYLSPVAFYSLPFRLAPYIRVAFFILNIRDLRETLVVIAGMIATYLNVLLLGLLFLLFSSWLAYVMFEDTEQGETIFTSYGATTYHMFILFTTSNNPDVWIPAYKASRWYSLFFILYVLLGVYFVTNLILAVVYDSFKGQLAKQVVAKDGTRNIILRKAFNLMVSKEHYYLDEKQCSCLFKELSRYRTLPDISEEDFGSIFYELDDGTRDSKIHFDEFTDICNAIAVKFLKEDSLPWLDKFPFYDATLSKKLKAFVRDPNFEYVVISVLILNLITVIIETTLDIQDNSGQKFWEQLEVVFGWLYFLELVLKVYSYGFENYWRDGQNRFDFVITMVIVIIETTTFVSPKGLPFLLNGEWIRYLLIARMLRLIRLLIFVRRYRAFVASFLTLIPSLMPYLGTIFCVLCVYCSVGVQIFGGLVNAGNLRLAETDLADNDYLLFNFNDYPSGMVTLFNLLVMGNWQSWMQSYKVLTDSAWSYIYFVSFYLVTILLLLNLVVAFVLEAFFAEMDIEDEEKCNDNDKKNEGKDTEKGKECEARVPRRRYGGTKTRSQKVDALLHRMLSSELKQQAECSNA
ncbi:Two-pore calcium channel [Heracleum sosnowskyi]|uniref:Two-pore calcium channel n=1 Tax=Heracleum sosnowskyi TaxID=360622 RepID=A0AAD8JJ15_9APIA|nr:Two-pore calcium channel [Heracleum sosnowskyi]